MRAVSVSFTPIGRYFFGSMEELAPMVLPVSRVIPAIYTVVGAITEILVKVKALTPEMVQDAVREGMLRFYGVYLKVDGEDFIPAPRTFVRGREGLSRVRLINEVWSKGLLDRKGVLSPPKSRALTNFVIPLSSLPDVKEDDLKEIRLSFSERIGIKLRRKARVVEEGLLFSRTDVEPETTVSFCVDVEGNEEYEESVSALERFIGNALVMRMGGESSHFIVRTYERTPLRERALRDEFLGKTVLAVSHLPCYLTGNTLSVLLNEYVYEVERVIGDVKPLGGWDMRSGKPKKAIAALTPGSVMFIGEKLNMKTEKEWYINLLGTTVEVRLD